MKSKLDPKYTKICLYAGVTVIITFAALLLLLRSGELISKARDILTAILEPLIFGGILCYLLSPLVSGMQKRMPKNNRKLAVLITLLIFALILVLLLVLIVVAVTKQVGKINFTSVKELITELSGDFEEFASALEDKLSDLNLPLGDIGTKIVDVVGNVKSAVSTLVFSAIFSVYLLMDGGGIGAYWRRVIDATAGEKTRLWIKQLAADADKCFSGYLRGQVIDAAIVGVLVSVAMIIAGVPYGIVVGILTGIGNLIPYVGTLVGFLSLVLVCVTGGAMKKLVVGAVVLVVVLVIDGNIINPRLLSSNIQVHPLLVVAALIGGGALGGFAGMLIAVPTAALLKIQLDRFIERKEKAKLS